MTSCVTAQMHQTTVEVLNLPDPRLRSCTASVPLRHTKTTDDVEVPVTSNQRLAKPDKFQ